MFTKALLIDFKETDIPQQYLGEIKRLFKVMEFITRSDSKLKQALADTEAIFVTITTRIDVEVIDAAPQLKYIGVLSTAFNAIDAQYARTKKIAVCNLGGYSTEAVAEFFFASLFETLRDLERAKQQAREQDFSFNKFMGQELRSKTLGIIGAGKIGSRTAEIGLGLGMKVKYFSRKNRPRLDQRGAQKEKLEDVLSSCDFISLNLALNDDTQGIIHKERVALLKNKCIFINLSPPALIDQEAMIDRAKSGDITFIFDHSDDLSPVLAKKFLETPNCVVYPPVAFRTKEADTARWETFVANIVKFAQGKAQNVVN